MESKVNVILDAAKINSQADLRAVMEERIGEASARFVFVFCTTVMSVLPVCQEHGEEIGNSCADSLSSLYVASAFAAGIEPALQRPVMELTMQAISKTNKIADSWVGKLFEAGADAKDISGLSEEDQLHNFINRQLDLSSEIEQMKAL